MTIEIQVKYSTWDEENGSFDETMFLHFLNLGWIVDDAFKFQKHRPKCGLCGSTEMLIGPYAGGPFGYYCAKCRKILDIYFEGRKAHKEWFERVVLESKLESGMRLTFAQG